MNSDLSQGILPKQQIERVRDKVKKPHIQESDKVPVRIDGRTIIFVLPSEVEGAKERYILRHQNRTSVNSPKNYKGKKEHRA